MITETDIEIGAKFKTDTGIIWKIDNIKIDSIFDKLVDTSMEGGKKGNYRDEVAVVIKFLNKEKAIKL